MSTLGIIAEYNPFHNGHLYHLQKSLDRTGASTTIVVMSSSFLQRGEPAVLNKWRRTLMALKGGVDLVVELPLLFACSSAEHFARAGISLLSALGCDHVAFGCESDSPHLLHILAKVLAEEPPLYKRYLRHYLNEGFSFPCARTLSCMEYLAGERTFSRRDIQRIMSGSNNILALEYLKSILILNSKLKPVPIRRTGPGYHEQEIKKGIASATAIRNYLQDHKPSLWSGFLHNVVPPRVLPELMAGMTAGEGPIFPCDMGPIVLGRLRVSPPECIAQLPDIETGLENRLTQVAQKACSWHELISLLATRRYVRTRIQRLLVYVLLNISKENRKDLHFTDGPMYIRILGFNARGKEYLNKIKKGCSLPLLTRVAPRRVLSEKRIIQKCIALEARATDLLALVAPNPEKRQGGFDYSTPPVTDL